MSYQDERQPPSFGILESFLVTAITMFLGGSMVSYVIGKERGRELAIAQLQPTIIYASSTTTANTAANTASVTDLSKIVSEESFERDNNHWAKVYTAEYNNENNVRSSFPESSDFPGSIMIERSAQFALTGESSLQATVRLNKGGEYKSVISREFPTSGSSITIYVMAPDLSNVTIHYIQLCVPSQAWVCSSGTRLQPNEWTPITIDLAQTDDNGVALYNQRLTELAIQWKFTAKKETTLNLYFDTMLITKVINSPQ